MIVTAYYNIPSKKSHSFYFPHLIRWVRSCRSKALFFTTPDVEQELAIYNKLGWITFIHEPFENLVAFQKFDAAFWARQKERDPEPYHTTNLAAVWFEKKEFVQRAIQMFPQEEFFIWCDAGCVRDDAIESYFQQFGNRDHSSLKDGKLHTQMLQNPQKQEYYVYPHISQACAIMAGTPAAWIRHSPLYDQTLQEYDDNMVSGNSDQNVLQRCINKQPEFYCCHAPPHPCPIDVWFFFISVL